MSKLLKRPLYAQRKNPLLFTTNIIYVCCFLPITHSNCNFGSFFHHTSSFDPALVLLLLSVFLSGPANQLNQLIQKSAELQPDLAQKPNCSENCSKQVKLGIIRLAMRRKDWYLNLLLWADVCVCVHLYRLLLESPHPESLQQ